MNYTPQLIDVEQGTDQWLTARACARVTASRMHSAIRRHKSYAKEIRGYIAGEPPRDFYSKATQWGNKYEPIGAAAYELACNVDTEKTGFWITKELDFIGGSPDPLVIGGEGFTEIKCPYNPAIHTHTMTMGEVPKEHLPQIHTNMLCTGRLYCDFISFDPRQPPGHDLFIKRVLRDDEYIESMIEKARSFMEWVLSNQELDKPIKSDKIPDLF